MLHALLREIDALEADLAKAAKRPLGVAYEQPPGSGRWYKIVMRGGVRRRVSAPAPVSPVDDDPVEYDYYDDMSPSERDGWRPVKLQTFRGRDRYHRYIQAERLVTRLALALGIHPDRIEDVAMRVEQMLADRGMFKGRPSPSVLRSLVAVAALEVDLAKGKTTRPLGVPYEQPAGSGRWYEVNLVDGKRRRKRVPPPQPAAEDGEDVEGATRWVGGTAPRKVRRSRANPRDVERVTRSAQRAPRSRAQWQPAEMVDEEDDVLAMEPDPHEEDTVPLRVITRRPTAPLSRRAPPKGFREWLADEVGAPPWLRRMAGVPMSKGLRRALWDLAVLEAEVEDLAKGRQHHGEGEEWTQPSGQRVRKVNGKVVNVPKDGGHRRGPEGSDASALAEEILSEAVYDRVMEDDEDQEWRFVFGEMDPKERRWAKELLAGGPDAPGYMRQAANGFLRELTAAGIAMTVKPPKRPRLRKGGMARALRDLEALEAELAKAARYKPGEVRHRPSDDTYWQKPVGGGKLVQVADMAGTPLGKREKGGEKKKGRYDGWREELREHGRDVEGLDPPLRALEYRSWFVQPDDVKAVIPLREFVEVSRSHGAYEAAEALATLARSRGLVQKRGKWVKATPAAPAPTGFDLFQSLIGANEEDIKRGMRVFGRMPKADLAKVVDAMARRGMVTRFHEFLSYALTKKSALLIIGSALRWRMGPPSPPPAREPTPPAPTGWRPGMPTAAALAALDTKRGGAPKKGKAPAPVGVDMAGTPKKGKAKAKAVPTPVPEPVATPPAPSPAPAERIQLPPRRADDRADVHARLSEAAAGAFRGNVQELEERLWAAFREAHSADRAEQLYPDTVRALRARLGELGGKEWPVRFEGEAQFSNAGQAYWELQTPGMGEQAIRETLRGRLGIGASPKAYRWLADRLGVDVPDGTAREMQQALVRQLAARGSAPPVMASEGRQSLHNVDAARRPPPPRAVRPPLTVDSLRELVQHAAIRMTASRPETLGWMLDALEAKGVPMPPRSRVNTLPKLIEHFTPVVGLEGIEAAVHDVMLKKMHLH